MTAGAVLALAACGASGDGRVSPGENSAQARCTDGGGFELSLASDTGGQSTPVAAAIWFATHGGVQDLPEQGWHVVDRNKDGVTLRAGARSLHVIQGSDRTWQVDSGTHCG